MLDAARRTSALAVNALVTAAYSEIGRRIVECEQGGKEQAEYGQTLVIRLAADLTQRFGRGFNKSNLYQMRHFYLAYQDSFQTLSGKSGDASPNTNSQQIFQTPSGISDAHVPEQSLRASTRSLLPSLQTRFPLPWSHYVLLLKVDKPEARKFYEVEALRGGWSVGRP